jgi:Sec-independent protein translocase protein TatA
MIGTSEIIVIALVAFILLFGAGRVPELAGIRGVQKSAT